jgi:uncharacterized membrane protein
MKKKSFIFLIVIAIIISLSLVILNMKISENSVTGEAVTGEITSTNLAVSIYVIRPPDISIISPENETYITSKNLLLNYSSEDEDNVWYNIDNSENITITSAVYFNTTKGTHTLYIYANNSEGENSSNISFTVDSDKFEILYSKYANSKKGSSTNFNSTSYENMQNLSNIILENNDWGKIHFYEEINLTDDYNKSDNRLDLDSYTNISSNRIEINSTALPNFNKSATLYLYNLTFNNPRILRDNSVCPTTICTEESYSEGTLKFNVTHFTIYSAEETPVAEIPSSPSGSGGGGKETTTTPLKEFFLSENHIHIKIKQGQVKTETFMIENTGEQKLDFTIETSTLKDFLRIKETSFELNPKELKIISMDIITKEDILPDLYIGKIIIKTDGIEKEILTVIEVESKKALFDVKVNIPDEFLYIKPGEEGYAKINIFNVGKTKMVDVIVDYIIKDEEGNNIISEQEVIAVETRTSFLKKFRIPENVKSGKYVFYVKVTYNGEVTSSSTWFNISKKQFFSLKTILVGLSIITGIILLIIIIYRQKPRIRRDKMLIEEKRNFLESIFKKEGSKENLEDYKKRIRERLNEERTKEKLNEERIRERLNE